MVRESLQLVLAERPTTNIVPGKPFQHVKVPAASATMQGPYCTPTEADLKDGELLLESLYLSIDATMRNWLQYKRSFLPPVQVGEVMRGITVSRVLASKSSKVKTGDLVTAMLGFREMGILPEDWVQVPAPLPANATSRDLIGLFCWSGLSGYFGMTKIGVPKPGDTVVVSAAAGATGNVAAQCRWLKEDLRLDVVLNYKDADFDQKFIEATPDWIDVCFDGVGGQVLDLALIRAKPHARFVLCGQVSQYNSEKRQGPDGQAFLNIVYQRIKLQGFLVTDWTPEFPKAIAQLGRWPAEGKIKRKETLVTGGMAAAEEAFGILFDSKSFGLVQVKDPEA
ncbi:hypothetical protein B0H66DRAFT_575295 [Apodospora peruviana]|uniref:Enoyl reductase (ER) domain-containing protein n=1 Tax=Apodospora peruviana TaxID=516989 RepID=A0AAE0I4X6_9PEZI|nr:hypothetical protein B0H66DRAFT_575295 [Apodospora peruviana]